MKTVALDVCVVGGGPAGCSAALRLARLGYRVAVVDREDRRAGGDETIASSIAPLLDDLGLTQAISAGALPRPVRKHLLWAERVESVQEDGTRLIDRRCFDQVLRDAAVGAGVNLLRPATARRLLATRAGWRVGVESESGRLEVSARFLIDARGRGGTGSQSGAPTVALCGTWRADRVPDIPEMLVDAVEYGWIWAVTRPDRSVRVLAFVDTQRCAGLHRLERERLYRATLAGSSLLEGCRLTELHGDVTVRDATWRVGDQIATPRSIKVGDRAFAMDPLSSQGVQSALRSGVQAGAVVHTILSGGDIEAAIQFNREAQGMAIENHRRTIAGAFAAQRRHQTAFWNERASGSEQALAESASIVAPARNAIVRLAADARIVDVPVIVGDSICRRPALVHPSLNRPVAWLGGTPIETIIGAVKSRMTVAELLSEYSVQLPPASAHAAMSWLLAHGIVTAQD